MFEALEGRQRVDWSGARMGLLRWTLVFNTASAFSLYLFVMAYDADFGSFVAIGAWLLLGLVAGVWLLAHQKTFGLVILAACCVAFLPLGILFLASEAHSLAEAWLLVAVFLPGVLMGWASLDRVRPPDAAVPAHRRLNAPRAEGCGAAPVRVFPSQRHVPPDIRGAMQHDAIAVIDFGGQYAHLIATKVRRHGVLAEIRQPEDPIEAFAPYKGIIISGSPALSSHGEDSDYNKGIYDLDLPILGFCFGHQEIAQHYGGKVVHGGRQWGRTDLHLDRRARAVQGAGSSAARVDEPLRLSHRGRSGIRRTGLERHHGGRPRPPVRGHQARIRCAGTGSSSTRKSTTRCTATR